MSFESLNKSSHDLEEILDGLQKSREVFKSGIFEVSERSEAEGKGKEKHKEEKPASNLLKSMFFGDCNGSSSIQNGRLGAGVGGTKKEQPEDILGASIIGDSMMLEDWLEVGEVERKTGAELCRVITNPESQEDIDYIAGLKNDPPLYLQTVSDFYDYLLDIAEGKGQMFDQGTFQVYDPAGHIGEFLNHDQLTYERFTSHLVELFEEEKKLATGGELPPPYDVECSLRTGFSKATIMKGLNLLDQYGCSLMSEWAGKKRHIFFANLGEYTFIKAENWATSGAIDVVVLLSTTCFCTCK